MSDPHEWHIANDKEGFFIEDEYGEEIAPPWLPPTAGWRCTSMDTARSVLHLVITDALANYEPSDADLIGDAWSGGFAENH